MKKSSIAGLFGLVLCGCAASRPIQVQNVGVTVKPLEVSVEVGERIAGETLCESGRTPTYIDSEDSLIKNVVVIADNGLHTQGASITDDMFIPEQCRIAAVYNAVTSAKADVIVMPQYLKKPATDKSRFDFMVRVEGYKGTYKDFKDQPPLPMMPIMAGGFPPK